MKLITVHLAGRLLTREIALWSSSGVVALLVHVGAIAWLMNDMSGQAAASPPTMVMLELAPEPSAPQATEEFLPPQIQQTLQEETTETAEQDRPDEKPEQAEAPQPIREAALQPEQFMAQEAAVPLPPQKQPRETKQPKPKKKIQAIAAAPPKMDAPPARMAAAPQTSYSSAQMNTASADWKSQVSAHVQRRVSAFDASRSEKPKKPSSVRFSIDRSGNIFQVTLADSSGNPEFDQVAIKSISRSSPLPPPPAHLVRSERMVLTMPVRFNSFR